ncbi:MAG: hypothetical protein NUV77_05955 [Thermoguttaceae bacterium]|jgi:hypothetical protein|nr:hypothetical protein [Thermoguttaceae bacterium]
MKVPTKRAAVVPQPITLSKLLLVEGETPLHFFDALVQDLGLDEQIEIRSFGGVADLGVFLKTLASTAEFRAVVKSLGIVRDAEDDPIAAKQSVDAAVTSAQKAGLLENVAVAVAIVPDGRTAGMIETLCLRSVDSDPIYACAEGFFACLEANKVEIPKGRIRAKHFAQVYLAGKDCPGLPVGIAAHRKAWPLAHAAFDELRSFVRDL